MSIPTDQLLLVAGLFFTVAVLYSSVGFGGGSSYLAILTFFLADQYLIRSHALICNISVVSIGALLAFKDGSLSMKKALLYTAFSVPAAFAGAMLRLTDRTFFIILAISLVLSSIGLFVQVFLIRSDQSKNETEKKWQPLALGGVIGYLSGMVGIGGGIFLSPIVNLLRWETARAMAGIASFFILANSLAGLLGLTYADNLAIDWSLAGILILVVVIGGFIGGKIKSSKLKSSHIKGLTALLVLVVAIRLLIKYI